MALWRYYMSHAIHAFYYIREISPYVSNHWMWVCYTCSNMISDCTHHLDAVWCMWSTWQSIWMVSSAVAQHAACVCQNYAFLKSPTSWYSNDDYSLQRMLLRYPPSRNFPKLYSLFFPCGLLEKRINSLFQSVPLQVWGRLLPFPSPLGAEFIWFDWKILSFIFLWL